MVTERMSVTLDENIDALQKLPGDRCPGEDGLSPILFTTLWDIIGPHLLFVVQEALQSGSLGDPYVLVLLVSFRKGGTRLFSRIGGPSLFLEQITKF